MELNEISEKIIGAAIQVHSTLGPGLLESAYDACLKYELEKRALNILSQVGLPIIYDGMVIFTFFQFLIQSRTDSAKEYPFS